jgi:hypothetical protein
MGSWITTTNTCVKSVTNPTNVLSPVSPISPLNPANTATTSATTQAVSAANAPTTQMDGLNALNQGNSAPSSTAQADAKVTPQESQGGKTKSVVGLILSLETIVKPALTQPNVFSEPQLVQGLPNEVLFSNQLFLDVYGQSFYNQTDRLKQIIRDSVELEQ